MLSAKLAKTTVNQSHSAIWNAHQGSAPVRKASMVEMVARAATISVARITGFRLSLRGSSLTKLSARARSCTLEDRVVEATAERGWAPRWTSTAVMMFELRRGSGLMCDRVQLLEVLDDRPQR